MSQLDNLEVGVSSIDKFLQLSFQHIPDNIPRILATKIRGHIPDRFAGNDDELQDPKDGLDRKCVGLSDAENMTAFWGGN